MSSGDFEFKDLPFVRSKLKDMPYAIAVLQISVGLCFCTFFFFGVSFGLFASILEGGGMVSLIFGLLCLISSIAIVFTGIKKIFLTIVSPPEVQVPTNVQFELAGKLATGALIVLICIFLLMLFLKDNG